MTEVNSAQPSATSQLEGSFREKLAARCKLLGIEYAIENGNPDDNDLAATVLLPSGKGTRSVLLLGDDDISQFLSIPFDSYCFLDGYEAIFARAGSIEAEVTSVLGRGGLRFLHRRLQGGPVDTREMQPWRIELKAFDADSGCTISIGSASTDLRLMTRGMSLFSNNRSHLVSLVVSRIGLTDHDQALRLLVRAANALFFQIDLSTGIALRLERARSSRYQGRRSLRPVSPPLAFPSHEYEDAPISLYWYARSASGMPLLQFLAYYQVLEFYFPTYSQSEARRKIMRILKDPSFRADRETDIGKILTAVKGGRSGFGDERSQLKATIGECIDPSELREFVTANPDRENTFTKKKGITKHTLPISNPTADLRDAAAERIYEIRCRVVHTKDSGSGEVELLLPFSHEAEQLADEIELVQFLAQKVLIAASTPFLP